MKTSIQKALIGAFSSVLTAAISIPAAITLNETNFYGQDSEIHFIGTDFGEGGELFFSYMSGLKGMVEFYICTL